jgi:putative ABC transport system ATP-binding protein
MISLSHLSKVYADGDTETVALSNISFTIEPGEFVSIMGPSGSGKSTLLHIMSFLDRPSAGSYSFFGKKIEVLSDHELAEVRNRQMGFVFQSFNLLGASTVYDNVALPLLYGPIPVSERDTYVRSAIEAVGLTEKIDAEASRLSGGQKQRVAIARALVQKPSVIFADEPTGNLDSASGAQVMRILETLHSEGHTIVLVTHESYTAAFARRIIRIKDGTVERDELVEKRSALETFSK